MQNNPVIRLVRSSRGLKMDLSQWKLFWLEILGTEFSGRVCKFRFDNCL